MRQRWHVLIVGLIVLGMVAALQIGARSAEGSQSGGNLSAASVLMDSYGLVGEYSLPEPPTYKAPLCDYSANATNVKILTFFGPQVKARASHPVQKVDVVPRLFQRKANGSLALMKEGTPVTAFVQNTGFTTVN